jgi:hypothetical protein
MPIPTNIRSFKGLCAVLLIAAGALEAQPAVELPRASPSASVSQTIGYTNVTVTYGRPAAKDRKIWGQLVPYGKAWRAGANEATTVEFSTDVKVNGQDLAKGKYGFFILPTNKEWTLIFSKTAQTWGSFAYDPKDDALRIDVAPGKTLEAVERLEYRFDNLTDSSAVLSMVWEKVKVEMALKVEFMETAKANIAAGLPKAKPDDANAWLNAARFYRAYDLDKKQAMEWVDKSIGIKPGYGNLWAKAQWLAEDKNFDEARKFAMRAQVEANKEPNTMFLQKTVAKAMAKWPGEMKPEAKK